MKAVVAAWLHDYKSSGGTSYEALGEVLLSSNDNKIKTLRGCKDWEIQTKHVHRVDLKEHWGFCSRAFISK